MGTSGVRSDKHAEARTARVGLATAERPYLRRCFGQALAVARLDQPGAVIGGGRARSASATLADVRFWSASRPGRGKKNWPRPAPFLFAAVPFPERRRPTTQ